MNTIANRFVITASSATVMLGTRPYSIAKTDSVYDEVIALIKAKATEADVLAVIEAAVSKLTKATQITSDISIVGGVVTYKGQAVANSLTEHMLKMLEDGFDLVPMAKFLENLMQNPSYRAVKELYLFLQKGRMPITPSGKFMAYKAVRKDYKDIHSGTMDNSIGNVVEMPRNAVDDDKDRTCSSGLHFCSFDYLSNFAHADGHVMLLEINPSDVVSIPSDYNDTKGRCCRYTVVGEYNGYYTEGKPFFNTSVYNPTVEQPDPNAEDDEFEDDEFEYGVYLDDELDNEFKYLGEAISYVEEKLDISNYVSVEIRSRNGDVEQKFAGGARNLGTCSYSVQADGNELLSTNNFVAARQEACRLFNTGDYRRVVVKDYELNNEVLNLESGV